jgi:Zn-dependent protease
MNDQIIVMLVIWYAVFVFSTTLHEAAHAFMAWRLGDSTAYMGGQASLDPMPHVRREPIGMIVVPLISFFINSGQWMMGWASAPYDPFWAMHHPRRASLMALAGPVSNLLLAFLAGLGLRYGLKLGYFQVPARGPADFAHLLVGANAGIADGIAAALSIAFVLNLALAIFNMFPFPPLDGGAVLLAFLPHNAARRVQEWLWDPTYQMLGLVAAWALGGKAITPVVIFGIRWIYGDV